MKTTLLFLLMIAMMSCSEDDSKVDSRCSGVTMYENGQCKYIVELAHVEDGKLPTYDGIQKIVHISQATEIKNGELQPPQHIDTDSYAIYKDCDICN